ncbi:hypothetical protein [Candidatus Poriferisodalis sp.]|uniref:hypothetical protein n=1 Tax=Candidatus Poriferisodalis sp. TaxID=3101277 RepID=UPI003B517BB7
MHADSLTVANPRRWRYVGVALFAALVVTAIASLTTTRDASASHETCTFNDITFTTTCFPGHHPKPPPPPPPPPDPPDPQDTSALTEQDPNAGEGEGGFSDPGGATDTDPIDSCGLTCEWHVWVPDPPPVIGVQVVQVVAPVQVVQVVQAVQVVQVVQAVQVVQVVAPVQVVQVVQAVQVVQVVAPVQVVQVVQNVPVQVVQNVPVQGVVNPPPVAPAAPSALPAPTPLLACNSTEFTGSFTGWFANPPSGWGRAAEYEVEWRHGSDPWESESVAYSGNQVLFDGDDNPGDSVDVRIRGRGRQRRYRLGQWSAWSAWGQWSNWAEFSTPTCPPPPLPVPTVMACRSTAGIEVTWTVPPGTGVGTGWGVDVNEWTGIIGPYTSYSITSSNALPWADRAVTLPVPAGQAYMLTVVAYDAGPPARWGSYSTLSDDTAADQPEAGCGLPPLPAVPGGLPDPAPALACLATEFTGRFTSWADSAPANWEREAEYEAEYLHSGGSWQTATVTRLQNAQVLITGPADPGNTIDVRLRGRGRQRERVNGTWSAWTPWGTWSGWHPHTTPPCPPLTPPVAPERPTVTCTGNSNGPSDATIAWTPVGTDTALVEHRYEASWYFNLQDVNASVRQTVIVGPHATLSTTITVDTDDVADPSEFDEPFDLLSIRVRVSTRIRASINDPWSPWSNWSDPSGPPDMVPGQVRCVVIVAS